MCTMFTLGNVSIVVMNGYFSPWVKSFVFLDDILIPVETARLSFTQVWQGLAQEGVRLNRVSA
jgi:hypothetical protein